MTELQQTKVSENSTYAIGKALHHANAASFYFDMVLTELKPKMNGKVFLKDLRDKAKQLCELMLSRLPNGEVKELIKTEIKDPLQSDSIMETFIRLDLQKRLLFEDYGAFLYDVQLAEKNRTEQGYLPEFSELIATHSETIDAHIKEREREISILKQQKEILGI